MKPALLLIDLQNDYLRAAELQPAAGQIVDRAAKLLAGCRERGVPILHVVTTVRRQPDNRMPHWKEAGLWKCEAGTPGHEPPAALRPIAGERCFSKQFFSAFGATDLDPFLRSLPCDVLLLMGVHLHACVRTTALDAYERGYAVWIAEDAVGSDDPLHAAITRRYLARRGARFARGAQILDAVEVSLQDGGAQPDLICRVGVLAHPGRVPARRAVGEYAHPTLEACPASRAAGAPTGSPEGCDSAGEGTGGTFSRKIELRNPADTRAAIAEIPVDGAQEVRDAVAAARRAWCGWRKRDCAERASVLRRLAQLLTDNSENLARHIANDVGKPITLARAEVRRSVALLHGVADRVPDLLASPSGPGAVARYQPLGVVAVVTPWNNPLAIPIGKIAPALLFGNAVVWKPAPPGTMIARRLLELMRIAGWRQGEDDLVHLCTGDASTAAALAQDPQVDGVTLSGSLQAGYALQEICNRRHVPFQGEMGGNNAAIVWEDADPRRAAREIAAGAFGFAGQRCTANRRAIVADHCFEAFIAELRSAAGALQWGDPFDSATVVGPLIDVHKRDEIAALLDRARAAGMEVLILHKDQPNCADLMGRGAYHPPAILFASDPEAEIVQEEAFGPVLVVQRAARFDEAIQLVNGVRQGLVAALFSDSPARQEEFLAEAQAGVLKINTSTVDADATSPLGGWKASGVGPAEHGACDREFFCRVQTVYGG